MSNEQVKRLTKVEDETNKLRRDILQLEFQHKKDVADFEKRFQVNLDSIQSSLDHTGKHLRHLSQLVGITFEKLDNLDDRLESASISLSPKNLK